MKLKTFYANSMAEALDSIKLELGPDALILQTREIRRDGAGGAAAGKGFEVVAATDAPDTVLLSPAATTTAPPAPVDLPANAAESKPIQTKPASAPELTRRRAEPRRSVRASSAPRRERPAVRRERPAAFLFTSQVA